MLKTLDASYVLKVCYDHHPLLYYTIKALQVIFKEFAW